MKLDCKTASNFLRRLPKTTEKDHFGSDAYCANKRIFATVWHDKNEVNVRLSTSQKRHFLESDGEAFLEIKNAWGDQGWMTIQLNYIDRKMLEDVLKAAWQTSATKFSRITKPKKK